MNLEADVLARYVRQTLLTGLSDAAEATRRGGTHGGSLDEGALRAFGFMD